MLPVEFLFKVVVITSSGAVSPGPLTAAAVLYGSGRGVRGGLLMSVGHMLVEFPYVLLISVGLAFSVVDPVVARVIGFVGGVVLVVFGVLMVWGEFRGGRRLDVGEGGRRWLGNPLLVGVVFTGLNPYFLVWWFFVGGSLVIEAFSLGGFVGVLVMFLAHIWLDYVWLVGLSFAAEKGAAFVESRVYRAILVGIAVLIVVFGFDFVWFGLFSVRFLPF